ncbi:MAG: MATE family efflux transporter [Lachnospiraceae bacterium]
MNTKDHELMARMKISKAVAAMAIPSVISSLVTVVYNMADTFFVGQTGDPLQVAAVSLTNPIFILFMAVANMFGMGGSAVASIALGGQDQEADETGVGVYYLCFSGGRCFVRGCIACFYAAHSDLVWSE